MKSPILKTPNKFMSSNTMDLNSSAFGSHSLFPSLKTLRPIITLANVLVAYTFNNSPNFTAFEPELAKSHVSLCTSSCRYVVLVSLCKSKTFTKNFIETKSITILIR
ncbi:hypothetical protein V8G54_014937 [Vigna mungo]|uniref:Uncharacterized protein n=1 Tax=Vigna mungo TaxID=3915 RepID=A0AAQ3NJ76_VIGMU